MKASLSSHTVAGLINLITSEVLYVMSKVKWMEQFDIRKMFKSFNSDIFIICCNWIDNTELHWMYTCWAGMTQSHWFCGSKVRSIVWEKLGLYLRALNYSFFTLIYETLHTDFKWKEYYCLLVNISRYWCQRRQKMYFLATSETKLLDFPRQGLHVLVFK